MKAVRIAGFSIAGIFGNLTALQTVSALPKDLAGESAAAEIEVRPTGKFLYASTRGHDSIAGFAIDTNRTLTSVEYVPTRGKTPRNFAIDPTGPYLVVTNQDSDNLVVFRIDPNSGLLKRVSEAPGVSSPACVTFLAHS